MKSKKIGMGISFGLILVAAAYGQQLDLEINQGYVLANGLGESQMRVRLLDSSGQVLSDNSTPVSFEVIQGMASISGPNPATASAGVATSAVGRTNTAGMVVVRVTATGFGADTDTLFAVSARKLRLTIDQDYILANGLGESQMSAELLDQDNRVIFTEDRTPVSFTVSGPASVVGSNPVTVQRGVAQGTLRSQTQEGWAVVTASAEGFTSSSDSVWIGNPTPSVGGRVAILAFVDNSHSFWPYIQRDIDMLDSLGVSYDLIRPQDLNAQTLSKYSLLIIPTVWAEYPWQTSAGNAAIVDFVSAGGGLIVTEAGYSGSYTPSFFPYPLTIDAGWAVGGSVSVTEPLNPVVSGLNPTDFYQYADSRVTSRDPHWRQIVGTGGEDAIVYCEYGTGFAIYTGYQVDHSQKWYVNAVLMAVRKVVSGHLDLEINQGYVLANGLGDSQLRVRLLDANGNLLSTDNSTSVSLEVIQGTAAISGPNPATATAGVATSSVGRTTTVGMVVVRATATGFAADTDTIFGISVSSKPVVQNFDDSGTNYWLLRSNEGPEPAVQSGGPTGGFLRLAHAVNSQINKVIFEQASTDGYGQVVADFDFRMTPGTRADGIGFVILNTKDFNAFRDSLTVEEPSFANSFGVGFDIYRNPEVSDPDNNHVSLHFGGREIQTFPIDLSVLDLANGKFNHAQIICSYTSNGAYVTLNLTPNGGKPFDLISNQFVKGMQPYEGIVAFGSRTGGLATAMDLDNIKVQFLDQTPPLDTHLRIKGFAGVRQSSSPLRTRVGRSLRFEVWAFSAPDSSDLHQLTDYTWQVPSRLGKFTSRGQLDLTTVAGVDDSITFQALGARASYRIITTPQSVDRLVITPAELTIAPRMKQTFRAQALDQYGNIIFGKNFGWHVVGDIGTIDPHTGDFTAADQPGEGYVIAVANGDLVFGDATAAVEGISKITVKLPLPEHFSLHQNMPNPFNPATEIEFELPVESRVRLTVYNLSGQLVEKLTEQVYPAGIHRVEWKAKDLPSGVYLYLLEAGSFRMQRKMTLLR